MEVKVGDRVKRRIEYGMEGGTMLPAEWGTVVYVHPEGRFYTVEFTFPYDGEVRKFRESYHMDPPRPSESLPAGKPRGSVDQDGGRTAGRFAENL